LANFEESSRVDVAIRRATEADAAALAKVGAALFAQTYADSIPGDELASHLAQDFGEELQLREIRDPNISSFLVERDRMVLGFAQLRHAPLILGAGPAAEGELWRIYLDRSLHGSGVAHRLLAELGEAARSAGASGVWLAVWERNERAISFYKKHGFERVGRQDFHVGGEVHCDLVLRGPANASQDQL
jgi:ribosomal protein S18 acetylase RimI-like enzyme